MRLRASSLDLDLEIETDEPFGLDPERDTVVPVPVKGAAARPDATAAVGEVLFRSACGDREGALMAAEGIMACVPVVLMTREELRVEPLGYWELHMLAHIDAMSSLGELIDDASVPPAEVLRVVCELVERRIIALR